MQSQSLIRTRQQTKPPLTEIDFNKTPFVVIWEVTRACALACVHCRAEAIPKRDPNELTTAEGFRLIDQICEFCLFKPLFVITGGDPMWRPDIYELIEYATGKGLRVAVTPSGTAAMTREKVLKLKEKGLARLAVSVDGSTSEIHDKFRKVNGSFKWTMNIISYAHQVGLPIQINTTITRHNIHDLENLGELMKKLGIVLWSVFFLVPVGRGKREDVITAQQHEEVFNYLYDLSQQGSFDVKTTEAPHYRRVVHERSKGIRRDGKLSTPPKQETSLQGPGFSMEDGIRRAPKGVNDGNGFVFISHTGEVYPSGFLPIAAGSVREHSLIDIYRNSPIFRELRNPSKLKGKCGHCGYKAVCGGSRARAYALTGDYLAEEPCCVYEPVRSGMIP